MGTNFYWITDEWRDWTAQTEEYKDQHHWSSMEDTDTHIGKRSAAGQYCWDCGVTLCQDGTIGVHTSKNPYTGHETRWFDMCPSCGKTKETQLSLTSSVAGVELGFAKSTAVPRAGVSTCCSFTWTKMLHKRRLLSMLDNSEKVVRDEYDREYTAREFLEEELAAVAIEKQYCGYFC